MANTKITTSETTNTLLQKERLAPELSEQFKNRVPSAIRLAQIEYMKRAGQVEEINTAIGNVTLPMHPALKERLFTLNTENSPFKNGIVKYTSTVGLEETNKAFLNIIASSGFSVEGLYPQVTDGGSQLPTRISSTITVPAAVPSLFQSSRPLSPSSAVK